MDCRLIKKIIKSLHLHTGPNAKRECMDNIRFSSVTLIVSVSSLVLLATSGDASANMVRTPASSGNFVGSGLSHFAHGTVLAAGSNAQSPPDGSVLTSAAQSSHKASTNRHHHRGVVPEPPAPQVATVPDTGNSIILLAIALGGLTALWSLPPSRRVSA